MKQTMRWAGLLGLLLCAGVGHAQQAPPPETPPVEVPAATEPATEAAPTEAAASEASAEETAAGQNQSEQTTPSPSELEALKADLERLRREAEEARRQQEERIRALEQRLQELQRPAPPPTAPPTPAPNPVTVRPGHWREPDRRRPAPEPLLLRRQPLFPRRRSGPRPGLDALPYQVPGPQLRQQ